MERTGRTGEGRGETGRTVGGGDGVFSSGGLELTGTDWVWVWAEQVHKLGFWGWAESPNAGALVVVDWT